MANRLVVKVGSTMVVVGGGHELDGLYYLALRDGGVRKNAKGHFNPSG